MDNLLYKNEILPYTFILELKEKVMIIKIDEYDFVHLVGKQCCKNLLISKLGQKEFFEKVLLSKITYNNLIDFNKTHYEKEYNWIQNKNNTFIIAFEKFIEKGIRFFLNELNTNRKLKCILYQKTNSQF